MSDVPNCFKIKKLYWKYYVVMYDECTKNKTQNSNKPK